MRVMALGSCMSNLTIAHLIQDYNFEQVFCIHHNRSDAFVRYYVRGEKMIPLELVERQLTYKHDTDPDVYCILRNQFPDHIGFYNLHRGDDPRPFTRRFSEEKLDVILMDNYMDIAAMLAYYSADEEYKHSPIFLNHGFYENSEELQDKFLFTDFLTPQQSASYWREIYSWVRSLQPTAKIFFLPYHSCSSHTNPGRFARAADFYPALVSQLGDEDISIIPPLEVPSEWTKGEEDWPHFQMPIYKALAGRVFLETVSSSDVTPKRGAAEVHLDE